MEFDFHVIILTILGLMGAGLWRVYSLISQRIDDKFLTVNEKITKMEKSMDEFKSDLKQELREIKSDLKSIQSKMAEMDKTIAVIQVNIHYINTDKPIALKMGENERMLN